MSLKELEKKSNRMIIRLGMMFIMFSLYCSNMVFISAGTDYGETIGKWILNQLFWIAVVVIAIVLIGSLLKRAYAAGGIILLVGAIVCFFIKNPEKFTTIGNNLGSTFGF